MAISGTTTNGSGFGCVSPATSGASGEGIWVTTCNAASQAMTTSDTKVIHSTTKIRCGADGRLNTFDSILNGSVVTNGNGSQTIPGSGTSTGYNFTGSVAVKRPTCVCTTMHGFYGRAKFNSAVSMKRITFEDGYVFECGNKISFMSINGSGVIVKSADALAGGDQIIKCSYPGGGEQPVQSGCTKVISVAGISTTGRFINAVSTLWPQSEYATSEVRGAVMLENGVYALWIPNGGSY